MAEDWLRKVRPGDQLTIPAQAYNAFVDTALALRSREHDRLVEKRRPGPNAQVVKTPPGGIPARSGTTIYSALCDVYFVAIPSGDPEDRRELEALTDGSTPLQLRAFNLSTSDVAGNIYVVVDRLRNGEWYVVVEPCA